ncbi:MAG: Abortive infection protein AbiEii [Candidatus Marinimicrobia bacterium]|nr:Abortive infection protein AbiEii [Candidatus Neomarinimicrobiota bacterium]
MRTKRGDIKNMATSVRARLLNIARTTRQDFNAVLLQYFQERFLYRLSVSPYKDNMILKGVLLFL